MTKAKLVVEVTKLLEENKVKSTSKLYIDLLELVTPKSGGGISQNPMIVVDEVNYHYCRYTELYLPENEMVLSKEKSKGYSKKAIAKWTKAGRDAQKLKDEAMKLLLSGEEKDGKSKAQEAEDLLSLRNKPEYYSDVVKEYDNLKLDQ